MTERKDSSNNITDSLANRTLIVTTILVRFNKVLISEYKFLTEMRNYVINIHYVINKVVLSGVCRKTHM